MKKRIAVLYGGAGAEHDVSVRGYQNIQKIIDKEKYELLSVFIDKNASWYIKSHEHLYPTFPVRLRGVSGFFAAGQILPAHCVFPLLHGDFGEDGRIQGALDTAGIPFVGCSVETSAVCRNKAILKAVLKSHGVPMLDWVMIPKGDSLDTAISRAEAALGYPMFVKPTSLGSSIGAGPARERSELRQRLESARAVSDSVMIERCLVEKRELECAFFEYKGKRYFTNPGEIRYNSEFYDYESKYVLTGTEVKQVDDVGQEIRDRIRDISAMIADVVGLKHFARIDFFLSSAGDIYFNEINTIPGLTSASLFPLMAKGAGVDLGELFLDLSRAAQTK